MLVMVFSVSKGQIPSNMRNLSTLKVDELSATQIDQFAAQLKSTNLTERELIQYLIARGMPRDEANKLLTKVGAAQQGKSEKEPKKADPAVQDIEYAVSGPKVNAPNDTIIYGSDFFRTTSGSFNVALNLPTPKQYNIGPSDELNMTVFGLQQTDERLVVNRDGKVNVDQVGLVQLGGLTLEQATARLKLLLARAGYSSLSTGQSQIVLSLENPRSIQVQVVGAVQSGTFQLPAVANILHALYMAGGPGMNGSFRQIRLVRNGKEVGRFDLYTYLTEGQMPDNLQLQANDLILIPPYEGRIWVEGEVKRPGLYEWIAAESFTRFLRHTGGLTDLALPEGVIVASLEQNEWVSKELPQTAFDGYFMNKGDRVIILGRKPELSSKLVVSGAVNYPGTFAWKQGLTLQDLSVRFGGFRKEALMSRGLIYRRAKNQERSYIRFSPELIASGQQSILLEDGDSIVVADKREQEVPISIQVRGEVLLPGELDFGKGMSVGDALLLAGGLKRSALAKKIEIARRTNGENIITQIIQAESDEDLIIRADELELQPGDWVIVRPNPNFREQRLVELSGEFQFPGSYAMLTRNEKLSSVLERAGGLTQFADAHSGILIRKRLVAAPATQMPAMNEAALPQLIDEVVFDTIAIDLIGISRNKNKYDLNVKNGDVVIVKAINNTVSVKGKVNSPVAVNHYATRMRPYLRDAGGLTSEGDKYRIYVIEPNGQARSTYRFLWMAKYPKVLPGSTIIVPEKPKNLEMQRDPARTAAVASIAASSAGVIIAIITLLR